MLEEGGVKVLFTPVTSHGILNLAMQKDHEGLFYKIASVLVNYGVSINYASVNITNSGYVFSEFRVTGSIILDVHRRRRMLKMLQELLHNTKEIKPHQRQARPLKTARQVENVVAFRDESGCSIMDLECQDREFLLFDISSVFLENKVRIVFAKISTFGIRVVDVFHLTDSSGQPISDKLKKAITKEIKRII